MNTLDQQLDLFTDTKGDRCVVWNVLERHERLLTAEDALTYLEQYEPDAKNKKVIPCDLLYLEDSNFFLLGYTKQDLVDCGLLEDETV